jgi:VWFA-related protein
MKRWLVAICALVLSFSTMLVFTQETATPTLQITGVNASELPTVIVTANVLDNNRRPITGLTAESFQLSGQLSELGRVVSVESTADDGVAFGVVLVIDTSSSMAGTPIEEAKLAATEFVNSLGPNDPVAIIAFNSTTQLVQEYTTNKDTLRTTIANLSFGGETDLYDAAVAGIEKAAEAPVNRRAIVILSDGAEFGGNNTSAREDGLALALAKGVSVYTIGLGFGTDRQYLQNISTGTNADYYEAPAPDELSGIFGSLAQQFRSQYIITLEADVPADGTEYGLDLSATTPLGDTNTDTAVVRAPIPTPIVSLSAPESAIVEPTIISPTLVSDDGIASLTATLGGTDITVANGGVLVDPSQLAPDNYELIFTATDTNGDVGTGSAMIAVGALPPAITVESDATGDTIDAITNFTLGSVTQVGNPVTSVSYTVADVEFVSDDAGNQFAFTLDPFILPAGEQVMSVTATTVAGTSATQEVPLQIAAIAPRAQIIGIEDGQVIDVATEVTNEVGFQMGASEASSSVTFDGESITLPFIIDLAVTTPGDKVLEYSVTDTNGQTVTLTTSVTVAEVASATPVEASVSTVITPAEGDGVDNTFNMPFEVNVEYMGSSPLASATFGLNGNTSDVTVNPDGTLEPVTIDTSTLAPGNYTGTYTLTAEDGTVTTADVNFAIAEMPTATPLPPTMDANGIMATSQANATAALNTAVAGNANATATADANATIEADANATATVVRQATLDTRAGTAEALNAAAASTAGFVAGQTATARVQPTTEPAPVEPSATPVPPTLDARGIMATSQANATAAFNSAMAMNANSTATSDANATLEADANATATVVRQATLDTRASTAEALNAAAASTAGFVAGQTATANVAVTVEATPETTVEMTVEATPEATLEATVEVTVEATPEATLEATVEVTVEATPEATLEPTAAPATQTPVGSLQTDGDAAQNQNFMPFVICGGAILLLILLLYLLTRRSDDKK